MSYSILSHRDHCRVVSLAELQSGGPTGPCLSVRTAPADCPEMQGYKLQPDRSVVRAAGPAQTFPASFVARLEKGSILPPYSILADGRAVLWDPLYQWGGQEAGDRQARAVDSYFAQPRRAEFVPGSHIALARDCDGNWGHWLIEIVPSLALTEDLPALSESRIVVPAGLSATQKQLLAAVGVAEHRLLYYPPADCIYEFERLFWPSPSFHLGLMSPHAADWLKGKLFPAYGAPARVPGRRIYVSRRDAPRRRLHNEDALVSRLVAEGYDIVVPSQTDLAEQVALFGSADLVMGPHGAGLSSAVFCAPDTVLIDLNEVDGWFMAMAARCGLFYGASQRSGIDFNPETEDEAVVIDDVLRFADWMLSVRDRERITARG